MGPGECEFDTTAWEGSGGWGLGHVTFVDQGSLRTACSRKKKGGRPKIRGFVHMKGEIAGKWLSPPLFFLAFKGFPLHGQLSESMQ